MFAHEAEFRADTAHIIDGLIGNRPALDTIKMLAGAEPGEVRLTFNCDFHWFDTAPERFGGFPPPLAEQVRAGAVGLKLHEDWGTIPAAIDVRLGVAGETDVQVAIHTDTLNESGFVEASIAALKGRTTHSFHTEGAGGGHAPDVIKVAGLPNVLTSSTDPTRPCTVNTIAEHLDTVMVCHHLDPAIAEDVALAESRIRKATIAAEDILHDLGAFSMMSSDSQAMGCVGEVITRTWQAAHKVKPQRGALPGDPKRHDNARVKRYVAKYKINPAIAHGIAHAWARSRKASSGTLCSGSRRSSAPSPRAC